MKNKLFLLLIHLAFFGGTNSAISMRPEADEWTDSSGHYAPAMVRKAADDLWEAVKIEGSAAFDNGWSKEIKTSCGCLRVCNCCITCGVTELCLCCVADGFTAKPFGDDFRLKNTLHEQREKEMNEALARFKETVNNSVLNPEQYSGDAKICKLGKWVEDKSKKRTDNIGRKYLSGRRDLSEVPQSTMSFVNNHGGWATEKKETLEVKVEVQKVSHDDEEAELRKELLRAQIAAVKKQNAGGEI